MYTQPPEADGIRDYRQNDEDIRAPGAKISKGTNDEKYDYLNSEWYPVRKQDNAIDVSIAAGEVESLAVASGLVEEVLEGGWSKVEES